MAYINPTDAQNQRLSAEEGNMQIIKPAAASKREQMSRRCRETRGQISIEYLIVLSFVTFLVISVLGLSVLYIDGIRDTVKFRQLEAYATKITQGAESVYYAGQPSKVSITAYLPAGVQRVQVLREGLLIIIATSSGESKTLFSSAVPLNNTQGMLLSQEGLHRITLEATSDATVIRENEG